MALATSRAVVRRAAAVLVAGTAGSRICASAFTTVPALNGALLIIRRSYSGDAPTTDPRSGARYFSSNAPTGNAASGNAIFKPRRFEEWDKLKDFRDQEFDLAKTAYNLKQEQIRMNLIRIDQATTSENLKLRESAVSEKEELLKQENVMVGLVFEVDGVKLKVLDLDVKKEDLEKVMHAQKVGQQDNSGLEDLKKVIKEAFQNLSQQDQTVVAEELKKVIKVAFDNLSQQDKIVVAEELKKVIKEALSPDQDCSEFEDSGCSERKSGTNSSDKSGTNSSDKSESPKDPFEKLWEYIEGLDWKTCIFVVVLAVWELGSSMDLLLLQNITLAWLDYVLQVPNAILNEAKRRTYPDLMNEKSVRIEVVFEIDGVKVKVAEAEVEKSELEILMEAQKAAQRPVHDGTEVASASPK